MQRFNIRGKLTSGGAVSLLAVLLCVWGCAQHFDAFVISKASQKLVVLDFDDSKNLEEVEGSPFATGVNPKDVAYDPRHRRIYVTNSGENTLSVYKIRDGERLEPLDKINTGETPVAVTVDTRNDLIYVLHQDGHLLPIKGRDLIPQTSFQAFFATNPYPRAADVAYDARNDLLYLIDQADNVLVLMQSKSFRYVKAVPTGAKPSSVAYDYRNNRVYVTNEEDYTLSVYEAGPFCKLLQTVDVGSLPSGVAYDDTNDLIFVSQRAVHQVIVYNAEDVDFVAQIELPTLAEPVSVATGLVNGASPALLYVANKGTSNVSVFEIIDPGTYFPLSDSPIGVPERPVDIAARRPRCPEIISMSPQEGKVGDTVTILGLAFGDERGPSRVEFGGFPAEVEDFVSWSDSKIEVRVPALAKTGPVRALVGNGSTAPPDGETVREFSVIPHAEIYVSARDGNDHSGDGSEARPYKTIKHALSRAVASDVIHISAGTYDRGLGERFPIRISRGVNLEARYTPTIKYDASSTAFEMAEGSSMKNIRVEGEGADSNATGVLCLGKCVIEDNVIWKLGYGIRIDGEKRPSIAHNDISLTEYGIFVTGGANPRIEYNNIFNNYSAISIANSTAYLGSNDIFENHFTGVGVGPGSSAFLLANYIRRNLPQDPQSAAWGIAAHSSGMVYLSRNNTIDRNYLGIVAQNAIITSNYFQGNVREGIDIPDGGRAIIFDNDIRYNGMDHGSAAMFVRSSNCLVDNNNFIENHGGIFVHGASGAKIVRNLISKNETAGITISAFAVIGGSEEEANTITENQTGIWVNGGDDVDPIISHNEITNNITGVFDCMYAEPRLFNNTIENNDWGVLASLAGKPFLGSVEEPGNNLLRNNTHVGLGNSNCSAVVIQAAGNTWNPSVQGADSNGQYDHQTVIGEVDPVDGNNYAIAGPEAGIEF
jgi:parallel beta-helix repeat protein